MLATLGDHDLFGASTLEEFHLCSYRWFVNHELKPRRIGPDPEPLENGGIVHEALERLFRERPGGEGRPTPASASRWSRRAREIVREVAEGRGWDLSAATPTISLARFDAILDRFLRRDALTGGPMMPDPELLEAKFGDRPGDDFPPAELGEFRLRGAIDRIDVEGSFALIRDYKLSAKVVAGAKLIEKGKLQLPLYMLAARGFGLEPIGALYSPLAATKEDDHRPRGLIDKTHKGTTVPDATEAHVRTDFIEPEAFEEIIAAGLAEANRVVGEIRSGAIDRNPREGSCPTWCELAPICRIERGIPYLDDEEEDDEEMRA